MNILAVMDDAYLNAELHQDSGAIHLALHLDLRSDDLMELLVLVVDCCYASQSTRTGI